MTAKLSKAERQISYDHLLLVSIKTTVRQTDWLNESGRFS